MLAGILLSLLFKPSLPGDASVLMSNANQQYQSFQNFCQARYGKSCAIFTSAAIGLVFFDTTKKQLTEYAKAFTKEFGGTFSKSKGFSLGGWPSVEKNFDPGLTKAKFLTKFKKGTTIEKSLQTAYTTGKLQQSDKITSIEIHDSPFCDENGKRVRYFHWWANVTRNGKSITVHD